MITFTYSNVEYARVHDLTPLTEEPIYTVFAVEKGSGDREGTPKRGAIDVTYDEAADYAERNDSPDNSERYVVCYRVKS